VKSYIQVEVGKEHFEAVGARESLDSHVHFLMFVQISSLGECKAAVCLHAFVGPFLCVDPQMVKKVMPFPERFVATNCVALQDLNVALSPGVLEREDSVQLGGGCVFVDPNIA
jgi:hypothetical protein